MTTFIVHTNSTTADPITVEANTFEIIDGNLWFYELTALHPVAVFRHWSYFTR